MGQVALDNYFHTVSNLKGGALGNCPRVNVSITIKAAPQSGQIKVAVISLLSLLSLTPSLFLAMSLLSVKNITHNY